MIDWLGRNPWPHQERGAKEFIRLHAEGKKQIVVTGPTGSGKSLIISALMSHYARQGIRSILYTNRRMLLDQLCENFRKAGLDFAVRASGMDDLADAYKPIQIAMIQTETSRLKNREGYQLFSADLAFVDEAHNQSNGECEAILRKHLDAGAAIVGFTATPLGIGHLYKDLVVAGRNSELRRCGALVPCYVYGCGEPKEALDLKKTKTGEFVEAEVVKAIMTPNIFGRVYDHWHIFNRDAKPTILFAPGVKESIWFAERFKFQGVKAAHIDGDNVWIDGEMHRNTTELRDQVASDLKSGTIKVVCNRFVLREGIDLPFLEFGILATIFGSLTGYLQSVGRLLRASPGKDCATLLDHGGNWHRHGSPNADQRWNITLNDRQHCDLRVKRLQKGEEPEPIICPKCGAIRMHGTSCVTCGYTHTVKSRPVVERDGTLTYMKGDIFRAPKTFLKPDTQKLWEQCYHACNNTKRTFGQAYGLFCYRHHYRPPRNLPLMPVDPVDWYARVQDVPEQDLIPKR